MSQEEENSHAGNFPKLSAPALRALHGAGYTRLEQLTGATEAEISKLHGMGPNGIKQLKQALDAAGLAFAPETPKPESKAAKKKGE
jgi:hypothetical protein